MKNPGNDQNGTDEHDERCTWTCLACFPTARNLCKTGTAGRHTEQEIPDNIRIAENFAYKADGKEPSGYRGGYWVSCPGFFYHISVHNQKVADKPPQRLWSVYHTRVAVKKEYGNEKVWSTTVGTPVQTLLSQKKGNTHGSSCRRRAVVKMAVTGKKKNRKIRPSQRGQPSRSGAGGRRLRSLPYRSYR